MRRTSGGCLRRGRVVNGATGVRLARETRSVNICAGMERVAPPGAVVVGVGIARVCAVKRAEERGHGGERLAVVVCGKWKPRPAGSGAKKRGGGGNKKQNGMNDFDEQPPMMNEDIMYVLCRTSVFGWSPRAPHPQAKLPSRSIHAGNIQERCSGRSEPTSRIANCTGDTIHMYRHVH